MVSLTKADKVIPAMADIYDSYGNPESQLSDNGSPFNSKAMGEFAARRGIELKNIPSLHPSSNPAETFMKPLAKTMKSANVNKTPTPKALTQLLNN